MVEKRDLYSKKYYLQKQKTLIALLIFIFIATIAFSQNSLVTQTLEKARMLRNDKKFAQAANVLGTFEKQYPGNLWIERLYAQTLYWMHDYQKSDEIYRRALHYHPGNMDLKYEYSLLLFSMKKYDAAKKLLQDYTKSSKDNGTAEGLLGKIDYYQRHFKAAAAHLKKALGYNPGNKELHNLYKQIYRIISPNIRVEGMLRSDTQPMNAYGPDVLFQWYHSHFLDLIISANYLVYSKIPTQNSISFMQVGNVFRLGNGGAKLKLSIGGNYSKLNQSQDWNGGAWLTIPFGKSVKMQLAAQRLNYNYTESSVMSLLMINQYNFTLKFGKWDTWNGMAGAQTQYYPDNNYISAFYVWFLSKPLNLSPVKLSLGYAFNYMNAKEDRFILKSTYIQIHKLENSSAGSVTQGIYDPYYTPHNQFSNSLLINLSVKASAAIKFYAHTAVSVYSKTKAPYFVDNGQSIEKTYGIKTYFPMDLGASLDFDLGRSTTFSINESYQKTYYYNSNNLNLSFRFFL